MDDVTNKDGMSHDANAVQYRSQKMFLLKVGTPVPPSRHIKDLLPDPRGEVLRISSDGDDRISGSKNQDPKKSLGLPAKPNEIPGPKINSK